MANRNELSRIDPAFLMVGEVYRLRSRSLGNANVEYMGGTKIKVVRGELVHPATGQRLKEGAILGVKDMHADKTWYELADVEVITEPEELESE